MLLEKFHKFQKVAFSEHDKKKLENEEADRKKQLRKKQKEELEKKEQEEALKKAAEEVGNDGTPRFCKMTA